METIDPAEMLKSVVSEMIRAGANLEQLHSDDPGAWAGSEWRLEVGISDHIENAFLTLLVLTEQMQLPQLNAIVRETYAESKRGGNLGEQRRDPDGDPYLVWGPSIWRIIMCLQTVMGEKPTRIIDRSLTQLVRACEYAINDKTIFDPPTCEADVDNRIGAILECTYPDLRRSVPIDKPVSNFIADAGIPSLETLIEYKFVNKRQQVKQIADQILADVKGYSSPKWPHILFVIYETERLKSESEWRQLLQADGLPLHVDVVVLRGEPSTNKKRKKASKKARRAGRQKKAK